MTRLVFLDTETTGLSLDDDIWEIAAIVREPGFADREVQVFVQHSAEKAAALPDSFRADHDARFDPATAVTRQQAAALVLDMTRERAHIVGAVPNFDTERLARLIADEGLGRPSWHYHLIDVETLAVGYLGGYDLPWDSDELSRAVGVEPPTKDRHTALGDARWVRDLYDAVCGP